MGKGWKGYNLISKHMDDIQIFRCAGWVDKLFKLAPLSKDFRWKIPVLLQASLLIRHVLSSNEVSQANDLDCPMTRAVLEILFSKRNGAIIRTWSEGRTCQTACLTVAFWVFPFGNNTGRDYSRWVARFSARKSICGLIGIEQPSGQKQSVQKFGFFVKTLTALDFWYKSTAAFKKNKTFTSARPQRLQSFRQANQLRTRTIAWPVGCFFVIWPLSHPEFLMKKNHGQIAMHLHKFLSMKGLTIKLLGAWISKATSIWKAVWELVWGPDGIWGPSHVPCLIAPGEDGWTRCWRHPQRAQSAARELWRICNVWFCEIKKSSVFLRCIPVFSKQSLTWKESKTWI